MDRNYKFVKYIIIQKMCELANWCSKCLNLHVCHKRVFPIIFIVLFYVSSIFFSLDVLPYSTTYFKSCCISLSFLLMQSIYIHFGVFLYSLSLSLSLSEKLYCQDYYYFCTQISSLLFNCRFFKCEIN